MIMFWADLTLVLVVAVLFTTNKVLPEQRVVLIEFNDMLLAWMVFSPYGQDFKNYQKKGKENEVLSRTQVCLFILEYNEHLFEFQLFLERERFGSRMSWL